jgi:hypothetical protein
MPQRPNQQPERPTLQWLVMSQVPLHATFRIHNELWNPLSGSERQKVGHRVCHSGFIVSQCIVAWLTDTLIQYSTGEISGSHGGEYEDDCLLGCCAVLSGRSLPTFQRCLLPSSSGWWETDEWLIALMTEAASTFETLVNFYHGATIQKIVTFSTVLFTVRTAAWKLGLSLWKENLIWRWLSIRHRAGRRKCWPPSCWLAARGFTLSAFHMIFLSCSKKRESLLCTVTYIHSLHLNIRSDW